MRKYIYEDYKKFEISNIEVATNHETYFDVNVNGVDAETIETYACDTMEEAEKLAAKLSKKHKAKIEYYYGD